MGWTLNQRHFADAPGALVGVQKPAQKPALVGTVAHDPAILEGDMEALLMSWPLKT